MVATKRAEERDAEFENATAFTITKPVELTDLAEEYRKAVGWTARKQFGFICEGDPTKASEESPATVWLSIESGDKPDIKTFKKVVTDHDFQEHQDEMAALREKAADDKDLTDEEMQLVVRRLLLHGSRGF